MKEELVIEAVIGNLDCVFSFIHKFTGPLNCSKRTIMQLDLVVEEIFTNIASYAYTPNTGLVKILLKIENEPLSISLTFIDSGIPYNPLEKSDPDVSLLAEDRQIGGLGIFLTKKLVNDISYQYLDGQNILKIEKYLIK